MSLNSHNADYLGEGDRVDKYSKLADWDDDDPQALQDTSSRWDKVVILKHMFTLQELEVCQPGLVSCFSRIPMLLTVYHRKIQPPSLTSRKIFATNAQRPGLSLTWFYSTRKLMASRACGIATPRLPMHV